MRSYKEKIKSEDGLYKVVYFIRQSFDVDSIKLRASVIWISENIAYDIKSFIDEDPKASELGYVIKNKKAVCGGYAKLLKYFCDAFNIECEVVEGFGRGTRKDVVFNPSPVKPNHAWNAVKINGIWKLIDPTWISGYVDDTDENNMIYRKKFNEVYYFTSPDRFVLNHFPKQTQFQYLESPIKAKQFRNWPLLTTQFIYGEIKRVWPDSSYLKVKIGDTIVFRLETPESIRYLCAQTENIPKADHFNLVVKKGGWYEFSYPVTVPGFYNLYIGYCSGDLFSPLVVYKLQAN